MHAGIIATSAATSVMAATIGVAVAYANADGDDACCDVDAPHEPFEDATFFVDDDSNADVEMSNSASHLASAFASVVATSTVAIVA
jgi:hypothetical protein